MRILVVSDTHRDRAALRRAILNQPQARTVIHLGDGAEEAEEMKTAFPDRRILIVRGNCDWGGTLPTEGLVRLAEKNIFYTHGYTYNVKLTMCQAVSAAREKKADVLLFGHTHQAFASYEDGLYVMNPGSLHGTSGTYGTLDISSAGIVTNIVKI